MKRRNFLGLLAIAGIAPSEVWIPGAKTIFLPPSGGWANWVHWTVTGSGELDKKTYTWPVYIYERDTESAAIRAAAELAPIIRTIGGPRITKHIKVPGLKKWGSEEFSVRGGALVPRAPVIVAP